MSVKIEIPRYPVKKQAFSRRIPSMKQVEDARDAMLVVLVSLCREAEEKYGDIIAAHDKAVDIHRAFERGTPGARLWALWQVWEVANQRLNPCYDFDLEQYFQQLETARTQLLEELLGEQPAYQLLLSEEQQWALERPVYSAMEYVTRKKLVDAMYVLKALLRSVERGTDDMYYDPKSAYKPARRSRRKPTVVEAPPVPKTQKGRRQRTTA